MAAKKNGNVSDLIYITFLHTKKEIKYLFSLFLDFYLLYQFGTLFWAFIIKR